MFSPILAATSAAAASVQLVALSAMVLALARVFLAVAQLLLMRRTGLEEAVRKVECRLCVLSGCSTKSN